MQCTFHHHSQYGDKSELTRKKGYVAKYRPYCIIILSVLLFFIGLAAGVLIGKLAFDKEDDKNVNQNYSSSADWGGMVTEGGVQKSVFDAVADAMKAENIMENLK